MTSSDGMPGHPAGPTLPVQPASDGSVPREWLHEYERLESAQRLDRRLEADQDLITTLALQGFEGPDYAVFETELAKYGIDVIIGWLRRGVIFAKCRERGYGGLPPPPTGLVRGDDVEELAYETVAKALWHFRHDVLLRNRWVASRGATVKTFFVGQCLMRFANIYRVWHKNEKRRERVVDPHEAYDLADQPSDGPEAQVVERSEILRWLRMVKDERVQAALILTAAGVPQWQIAARMDVTEKAVERMLANHRTRMRKLGIA